MAVERSAARLSIDLEALARNYAKLKEIAASAEIGGVVKADAYGLGAPAVTKALLNAGCQSVFVATYEEGAALRAALPRASRCQVFVLHGLAGSEPADFARLDLIPVISTAQDVDVLKKSGAGLAAALHVDTGMNRLGLPLEAANADFGFEPILVMSHLACADEPAHPLNHQQYEKFATVRARFPRAKASLANSAGTLLGPAYHLDLVRPGIALYGGNPLLAPPNRFEAVATLEAPVLQLRDARPGETVGYGASCRLTRPSRLAVLGIGYADGVLRSLSNRCVVAIGSHRAPVIGRVSMDLVTIDVTDIPEDKIQRGTYAQLFGPELPIDEVAAKAGTISYELLTRLGPRLKRVYLPAN